ncbi:tail protein X [Cellvibrio mixtus]|uniref:tail protein X n=1 Tax=Cellvibrio mixtus TaxID=39650 RepID=UPI000587A8B7|nr:tail protein X [Cellvibrio mixtus]
MNTRTDSVISVQGDTVDMICVRHYGYTAKVTEQVLAANPGLAALGAQLPVGTRVKLPAIAPVPIKNIVKLWD